MNSSIRSYSSGVNPCCAIIFGSGIADTRCREISASSERLHDRFEDHAPVRASQHGFARALGMRHQADDVACFVAEAGDGGRRAVGIRLVGNTAESVGVAEHDL